jgi:hypothetical protein
MVGSVWKYCQHRSIRVRRLDQPFTPAHGWQAAAAARDLAARGAAYSYGEVVASKLIPARQPNPERLYCSTFVGLIINASTGFSLYDETRYRPLFPSTLATHRSLLDVPLEWRPQALLAAHASAPSP